MFGKINENIKLTKNLLTFKVLIHSQNCARLSAAVPDFVPFTFCRNIHEKHFLKDSKDKLS